MYITLEKITFELLKHINSKSVSNTLIAKFLIKSIKNNKDVPDIKTLAKDLCVSTSTISRFTKSLKIENYQVLRYLVNNFEFETQLTEESPKINSIVKLITKAEKIYFWGISDSANICKDLHIKLLRMGINSIFTTDTYNQIDLSKLATKKDLLIIVSISSKHKSFKDNIKQNKAKTILITAIGDSKNSLVKSADIVLKIPGKYILPGERLVTTNERINAFKITDNITRQLLKNKKFKANNLKTL